MFVSWYRISDEMEMDPTGNFLHKILTTSRTWAFSWGSQHTEKHIVTDKKDSFPEVGIYGEYWKSSLKPETKKYQNDIRECMTFNVSKE